MTKRMHRQEARTTRVSATACCITRKHSLVLVGLVIALLLCLGTASGQSVVRVGFYENAPKLFTDETGRIVGFFPEIIEHIADLEGWALEYVPGTWLECLSRLEAGEIDLMPDVAYSDTRAVIYGFAEEPLFINWGIIYASPDTEIESIPDLAGKRIAVMKGSIHTEGEQGIKAMLSQFDIQSTYIEVPNYAAVLAALQANEADAGAVNRLFGLANEDQYDVSQTPIVFNPRELRFAYPIGSAFGATLANAIDEHVRSMKADSQSVYYTSIYTYLLRGEAPDVERVLWAWVPWVLGGIVGLLILIFVLMLYSRRRQRRLSTELAASEIQFETMFEKAAVGIAILKPGEGRFLRANPRFCEMLDYTKSELQCLNVDDIFHPEDPGRNAPAVRDVVEGRSERLISEERLVRSDGSILWGAITRSMVKDATGEIAYGIAVIQDITARKEAEGSLQEGEERLQSIFGSMSEGLALHEMIYDESGEAVDYRIVDVNPAFESILGIPRANAVGAKASELYDSEKPPFLDVYAAVAASGEPTTFETYFPPLDKHFLTSAFSPGEGKFGTVFADVTERRRIEVALKESGERLRSIIEQSIDGIALVDSEGLIVEWNEGQAAITGIPAGQALGRPFWDVQYETVPEEKQAPQLMDILRESTQTMLWGGVSPWAGRFLDQEIQRPDGEFRTIQIGSFPIDLGERRMLGSVTRDISDRKRSEEALRESEKRFRSVIEQAMDGLVLTGADGRILEWNRGQEKITGIPAKDAVGQLSWDVQFRLLPPANEMSASDLLGRLRTITLTLLAEEEPPQDLKLLEREIERPDGSRRIVEIGNFPIDLGESRILGTVVRDITDQKNTQQELDEHRAHLEDLVSERTEALNAAVEAANAAMFRHNLLTGKVERDERWFEIVGITQDEFGGTHESWRNLVHPDDLPAIEEQTQKTLDSHDNSQNHEYRIVRPDGEIRHIETRARILRDDEGKAVATVGMNIDITERRAAEEALRESDAFLRSMIEHMPVDFFAIDRDLRYVMQSPGSRAAVGDVIGKSADEIDAPAAQKEQWASEHRQVLAGATFRVENDVVTQDGELHTYLSDMAPVYVGEEIIAAIGVSIDITDRKRSEERIRQLSRAIEASPVSVVITDTDGTIEYVNPRFVEITGYGSAEAVGENPRILKSGHQPTEYYNELWETILSGRDWRGEFCNKKKSGDLFWELASISPIRDENDAITHFVAIQEDITERKYAAWDLEQTKRDAETANQAKSDFLANMSHELRTPLNAVIGFSEVLEDGTFGELNPKQAQYVGNILQSGRHLLSLINDILDLSKVEAGKMELELADVDVSQLIFESLIFVQEKAHQHGIRLETSLPDEVNALTIRADERKLKQILFNLLSNASKFTPDGGSIVLSAELAEKELLVRVQDTGIGLRPENLHRVFDEFEQIDSSYSKTQQGTGLGLALTKRLVEMHGGRIWAESEGEGLGSTFTFTLPLTNAGESEGS